MTMLTWFLFNKHHQTTKQLLWCSVGKWASSHRWHFFNWTPELRSSRKKLVLIVRFLIHMKLPPKKTDSKSICSLLFFVFPQGFLFSRVFLNTCFYQDTRLHQLNGGDSLKGLPGGTVGTTGSRPLGCSQERIQDSATAESLRQSFAMDVATATGLVAEGIFGLVKGAKKRRRLKWKVKNMDEMITPLKTKGFPLKVNGWFRCIPYWNSPLFRGRIR